jgi:hypothetical protein
MFANVSKCRFELYHKKNPIEDSSVRFNPWEYLPHSYLAMDRTHLDFFLFFLREIKELNLFGEVEVREGLRVHKVKVSNTRVVD